MGLRIDKIIPGNVVFHQHKVEDIDDLTNPLQFKGSIAVNSDFPTSADVENGWFYTITADVTDDDASKTNTGQSFESGDEIAWNGTDWTILGSISEISPQNTVQVDLNGKEIAGEVYTTIADALTYVATQSPSANNWWCVRLGSGQYSENVTIPEYVLIAGQGRWATEITGQVKGTSSPAMLSLAVDSVKISDLRADNDALILFFNCVIGGGSDTAGTTANYIFFDSLIQGGTFDDISQFHTYNSIIQGGTFSASVYNQFANTLIIPLMGNVVFGDDVYLDGCRITYSNVGTTTFTDEAKTAKLTNCSYDINAGIGATVPTFNTPNRTYNFYNTFLGDATYTAGTFNHYGTAEADENKFEKINLINSVDEFSTDTTLAGDSDTALPTEHAVKKYVDDNEYTSADFTTDFALKDTDDLAEGTTNTYSKWQTNAGGEAELKTKTDINLDSDYKLFYQ